MYTFVIIKHRGEQFNALLIRAFSALLKEPQFTQVSLFQAVMSSLFIGAIFFGQEHTQNGVTSINGGIFIVLMLVTFTYQLSVINVFCLEIPVFLREHYNGAYRVDTYYITKVIAEVPLFLVLPIISSAIIYWMIGMNSGAGQFVIFTLTITLLGQVATAWGNATA